MWVLAGVSENHQVDDIDNADTDTLLLQERRGGNDLNRRLHTDTDERDVRVDAAVGRVQLPHACARNAVTFCLLDGQEVGRDGFATNNL